MAVDTLRTNKMRSALTILGVVIGITSIVSMTALIRGFDESFKDLFRQIGPNTMFVAKFSFVSFSQGKEFRDLIKRPNITIEDAHAIERSPLVRSVAVQLGGGPGTRPGAITYGNNATKRMVRDRRQRQLRRDQLDPARSRPRLHRGRGRPPPQRRRAGQRAGQGALPDRRPDRQADPHRHGRSTRWSACSASGPNPLGGSQADEFAIIPLHHLAEDLRRRRASASSAIVHRDVTIIVIPREEVPQVDGHARGRGDHAGPPRPAPRPGERLRHRHPGRPVQVLGQLSRGSSSRWS